MADVLKAIGASNCDGISIHAYTHGPHPSLVYTKPSCSHPFENGITTFAATRISCGGIPRDMRTLPVYLTETDQVQPWLNQNIGWVQRVYGEIDWWNRQPCHQTIRAVILYRWRKDDQWAIEGKGGTDRGPAAGASPTAIPGRSTRHPRPMASILSARTRPPYGRGPDGAGDAGFAQFGMQAMEPRPGAARAIIG